MNKINNILITGGAGFIGSHFVKRMVNKGYNVTVIDNLERGKLEFIQDILDKITFVQADLRDFQAVESCFKNQDCVVHLASKVGGIGTYLSKPYEVMNSNITMDSNVLKGIIVNLGFLLLVYLCNFLIFVRNSNFSFSIFDGGNFK